MLPIFIHFIPTSGMLSLKITTATLPPSCFLLIQIIFLPILMRPSPFSPSLLLPHIRVPYTSPLLFPPLLPSSSLSLLPSPLHRDPRIIVSEVDRLITRHIDLPHKWQHFCTFFSSSFEDLTDATGSLTDRD